MSVDQLDLLGSAGGLPPWVPTTPKGRRPAAEYELFVAMRPDDEIGHERAREAIAAVQSRYGTPTSQLLKPSLWHITLLELGKFSGSYPRESLDAVEAALCGVTRSTIQVSHEGLLSFSASRACALTCSTASTQGIVQLRQTLVAALRARSLKCKPASTPHLTVFYDREHLLPMTALEAPIDWVSSGFSLLCSHKGLGHHEVVRRWPPQP